MTRILVTPRSLTLDPGDTLRPLEEAGFELAFGPANRHPTEGELLELVPGCTGWLAGVEPIGASVIDAADRLRVISRNGSGVDSIDLDAAMRKGIAVIAAAGANAAAVAELTVALMLCGLRWIPASAADLARGRWQRQKGAELAGSTVGIVGCGAVGRRVARTVASFGARVLAFDVDRGQALDLKVASWSDLDELLAASDIVSLHCPALPDGAPLLDEQRLQVMRPGVGLVNTARASLIDEGALVRCLDDGRVGWYATDVFAEEPPLPGGLAAHQRVIATPHVGAFTEESAARAARVAVENLLQALRADGSARTGAIAS